MTETRILRGLYGHTVAQQFDRLFLFGGAKTDETHLPIFSNTLWEVTHKDDTTSVNQIEFEASIIQPRNFHTTVEYSNALYIFGGKSNGYKNDFYKYDIQNNMCSVVDSVSNEHRPTPRYGHGAVVRNDTMLVFGGYDNNGQTDNNLYRYSFDNSSWLEPIPLDIPPRYHHTMLLYPNSHKIVIFGGCSESRQAFNDLYIVDYSSSLRIEVLGALKPEKRFGHLACFIDNDLHVLGGCDYENDFTHGGYSFSFETLTWERTDAQLQDSVFATVSCINDTLIFIGGVQRTNTKPPPIDTKELSDDIWVKILEYCDIPSRTSIHCVSKEWTMSKLSTINLLWKQHYLEKSTKTIYEKIKNENENELVQLTRTNDAFGTNYKQALILLYGKYITHKHRPQVDIQAKTWFDQARREMIIQTYEAPNYDFTQPPNDTPTCKAVIIGNMGVGKTSLLITCFTGFFPQEYIPTAFDVLSKEISFKDQNKPHMAVSFWDTAGGEDFDRIRPRSYPGADFVLIAFSVVDVFSYERVETYWFPEAKRYAPKAIIILVATKIDLRDDVSYLRQMQERNRRVMQTHEGEELAKRIGAIYLETSSYEGYGAYDLCYFLAAGYQEKPQQKQKKCKVQ